MRNVSVIWCIMKDNPNRMWRVDVFQVFLILIGQMGFTVCALQGKNVTDTK